MKTYFQNIVFHSQTFLNHLLDSQHINANLIRLHSLSSRRHRRATARSELEHKSFQLEQVVELIDLDLRFAGLRLAVVL